MITPTPGRVVLYYPLKCGIGVGDPGPDPGDKPLAATISWVWSDTCVNLTVHDMNGNTYGKTSVLLHQDGNPKPDSFYCEWMPYQKGQAAKYEGYVVEQGEPHNPRAPLGSFPV